jgi:YD repeat-containing protein
VPEAAVISNYRYTSTDCGSEPNTSSTSWYQQYGYDALNRLSQVHETTGNSALDLQQTFVYDRYGNRTINNNTSMTYGSGVLTMTASVDPSTNRMTAPSGYTMAYDAAGNLTTDNYTGAGDRHYDADNRMYQAWANGQWQTYGYDADGRRVKRIVNGVETWQVYGMGGELLAEYVANTAATAPQKEYGYRNGQLLVTAAAPTSTRANFALSTNGATARVSSSLGSGFPAGGVINGDRKGTNWSSGGGWANATSGSTTDWVEIDFSGTKTIDEIDVFTLQDIYGSPSEPTETMTFSSYGLSGYTVKYWDGSAWVAVSGGTVSSNNKVWKKISFAALATSKIRVSAMAGRLTAVMTG